MYRQLIEINPVHHQTTGSKLRADRSKQHIDSAAFSKPCSTAYANFQSTLNLKRQSCRGCKEGSLWFGLATGLRGVLGSPTHISSSSCRKRCYGVPATPLLWEKSQCDPRPLRALELRSHKCAPLPRRRFRPPPNSTP
jgi:hypothetical protein